MTIWPNLSSLLYLVIHK